MHHLVTLKRIEEQNAEARRIMAEYMEKQADNERACDTNPEGVDNA